MFKTRQETSADKQVFFSRLTRSGGVDGDRAARSTLSPCLELLSSSQNMFSPKGVATTTLSSSVSSYALSSFL